MIMARMIPTRFMALCAMLAPAMWAQVDTPLLGYLPDSGRIRPVFGIPAAALIAPALDFGNDFALVAVSPAQDYAIVSDRSSGAVSLAFPGSGTKPVAELGSNPDRIVMSPRGSAAVLWFASTNRLRIASGLPGSPSVREVDASFLRAGLRAGLADVPGAFAITDDGEWVAGSWTDGIYAFGPLGELRRLPVRERAGALAFFAGRHDLALVTPSHVITIEDVGGRAAQSVLYEGGSIAPAAIAVSSSNRHVVVAERSGGLLVVNLQASSGARYDCGCASDGLFPMGRTIFRLTGLTGGTFKIFDAATGDVFLVPLAASEGGGQ